MVVFKPDDFARDWYGFLSNQSSHVMLGVFWAWVSAGVFYAVVGEYPLKAEAWAILTGLYVLYELFWQGRNGWDTVEDTLFVCVYGAGGAYAAFSEVTPGDPRLFLDIDAPIPFAVVAGVHLATGAAWRWVAAVQHGEK